MIWFYCSSFFSNQVVESLRSFRGRTREKGMHINVFENVFLIQISEISPNTTLLDIQTFSVSLNWFKCKNQLFPKHILAYKKSN